MTIVLHGRVAGRSIAGLAAMALIALAPAAAGPPTFPICDRPAKGASDCFIVVRLPGCTDPTCCNLICALDVTCCADFWSLDCAVAAEKNCEPPSPCPGKGDCLTPHAEGACADRDCCDLLLRVDPFCAYLVWDALCVSEAMQLCGIPPCTLTIPPTAIPEPEPCPQRTNDGCNSQPPAYSPISCGQTILGECYALPPRDTDWYRLQLTAPRQITWTVRSEFPAMLMILREGCDPAIQTLAQGFARHCQPASVSLCLEAGNYSLFVAPGTDAGPIYSDLVCPSLFPNFDPGFYGTRYLATLTCNGCPSQIPADLSGDGHVTGIDLALLLGSWGTCPPGGVPCPADLNGNGVVNGIDLALLLGAWG